MNLDDLTRTGGEWLRGTGPESDIVMCSRIRLARNLATYPFINRANRGERADIERDFRAALVEGGPRPHLLRRPRPLAARPPVPRRAPAHLARARQRRRARGASPSAPRKTSRSWSTRRTTSASRSCTRASP